MTVSPAFPTPFSQISSPSPRLQASIVIPARDEAQNIGATLESLGKQRDLDGSRLDFARFEILLLCNNCSDATAQVARDFATKHPEFALHVIELDLPRADANVGFARRILMDAARARLQSASQNQPRAICSTDADTLVFPTWIAATLAEIAAGAEAVGGRILVANNGDCAPRAAYLRDTAYRLYAAKLEGLLDPQSADPAPRHFQFFGASLALTPRAYALVGGLPRVSGLEDVELERALTRADIAIRHSPHVRVLTSARFGGRVEVGLSSQLRQWNDLESQNRAWLVPSAPELRARFDARRALRSLHSRLASGQQCGAEIEAWAHELRLNPRWLAVRAGKTSCFGSLWLDLERALAASSRFRALAPPVPVEIAIAQLRAMLEGVGEK